MADFLSVEDAADQLGVSEALVRQWIKRGLARATRRGGSYILRQTEVDRLHREQDSLPQSSPSAESQETSPNPSPAPERVDAAPEEGQVSSQDPPPSQSPPSGRARPKVLPPRSGKDPSSFSGERDRRRRMGRRASDFTLEILHHEIKNAVAAALDPLLPRLDDIQEKLSLPAATPSTKSHQLGELEQRIVELEGQQRHLEEAREDFRQRLEESQKERQRLEKQLEQAPAQPAQDPELVRRLQESERERQRLETWAKQVQAQQAQHDGGTQHLLQRLSQEMQHERQLRLESQEQLEKLQGQVRELESASLTMEAERARFSLESRSLQGEIDRLTSLQEQWNEQKRDLDQTRQNLLLLEKTSSDADKSLEEKDQEVRRLREQVNSLTYKLQMAGTGATGPSPEESRRLMEKLADAQTEMNQKNELINQNYAEISELRSKLDVVQRSNYEIQQRYDKLYDEWGQLAAQMASKQMLDHQLQQSPPPNPDRNKGWGLFGRRDG